MMDWSKAKTILIISFALLNGLLGYQLWVSWNEQHETHIVSSRTIEELDQLLAAQNVTLAEELTQESHKLGYLQIDIVRRDTEWQPLSPSIRFGQDIDRMTEQLQKQVGLLSKYVFDPMSNLSDNLVFLQTLEEFPIYVSTIEVKREAHRLTAYKRTEIAVKDKKKAITVITPHVAVKTALENERIPHGATIVGVDLGYAGSIGEGYDQLLMPVWRISVIGESPLYVNALTGSIETDGEIEEEARNDAF